MGSGAGNRTASRRQFIKVGGALLAAGILGTGAGALASRLSAYGPSHAVTDTKLGDQTATSTSSTTITQTELVTSTEFQTSTVTSTVSQTATTTSTAVATVTETMAPPDAPFSVFWVTDTQFLSEENPVLYAALTNWIVENWSGYNAKFLIHTGDVVQTGSEQAQWQNADQAMSVLLQNGIPYAWCAGNHDDLTTNDATSGWIGNQWASFDPIQVGQRINATGRATWVGDYHDGMNTAATFSANGLNFLVVTLEWNAQPDALAWAESILKDPSYADYHTIIAPHAYVNAEGATVLSSNNVDLSTFIATVTDTMDSSPNVFLSLNGHYASDCGYNTPEPLNHRNELMFDRQDSTDTYPPSCRGDDSTTVDPDYEKVGGATVTILTFDTANNRLDVSTYDVNMGEWRSDEYEKYSVELFPE